MTLSSLRLINISRLLDFYLIWTSYYFYSTRCYVFLKVKIIFCQVCSLYIPKIYRYLNRYLSWWRSKCFYGKIWRHIKFSSIARVYQSFFISIQNSEKRVDFVIIFLSTRIFNRNRSAYLLFHVFDFHGIKIINFLWSIRNSGFLRSWTRGQKVKKSKWLFAPGWLNIYFSLYKLPEQLPETGCE